MERRRAIRRCGKELRTAEGDKVDGRTVRMGGQLPHERTTLRIPELHNAIATPRGRNEAVATSCKRAKGPTDPEATEVAPRCRCNTYLGVDALVIAGTQCHRNKPTAHILNPMHREHNLAAPCLGTRRRIGELQRFLRAAGCRCKLYVILVDSMEQRRTVDG